MYSGTSVCAGQAHWQSTTRWKYSDFDVSVGSMIPEYNGIRVVNCAAKTVIYLWEYAYESHSRPRRHLSALLGNHQPDARSVGACAVVYRRLPRLLQTDECVL